MDLRATYDAIMELQAKLVLDHDDPELQIPDYRKVQALAATYTLQGYLANAIAAAEAAGELEPEEEGADLEDGPDRETEIAAILGITNRPLGENEKKYVQRWIDEGFDNEAIKYAYDITLVAADRLSWPYMHKVLSAWGEDGKHTGAEVKEFLEMAGPFRWR